MWYDLWQLVTVDSFTLFTLLWPGLRGRSVFLKKKNKNKTKQKNNKPCTEICSRTVPPDRCARHPTVCEHRRCHHLNLSPLPSSPYAKHKADVQQILLYPFTTNYRGSPHHTHLTSGHAFWDVIHEKPGDKQVHLQVQRQGTYLVTS